MNITEDLFRTLQQSGAVGIPDCISEEERCLILKELSDLLMVRRPERYKKATQNFFGFDGTFNPEGALMTVVKKLQTEVDQELSKYSALCAPIVWNDFSLQQYPVTEGYGVSPHVDVKNCINVVVVLLLKGESSFYLCDDREATNPQEVEAHPGGLIVMRSTGFLRSAYRPFHYVGKVRKERITFAMRQTVDKETLSQYYNEV